MIRKRKRQPCTPPSINTLPEFGGEEVEAVVQLTLGRHLAQIREAVHVLAHVIRDQRACEWRKRKSTAFPPPSESMTMTCCEVTPVAITNSMKKRRHRSISLHQQRRQNLSSGLKSKPLSGSTSRTQRVTLLAHFNVCVYQDSAL